jgi:hypothetical protein
MKVHRVGGVVEFKGGSILPPTDRSSFLASALAQGAEVLVENEPHITFRIRPERGIAAAIHFEGAKLRNVSWQFELPPEKEAVWSAEHELERKQIHDDWLKRELGAPPYRFPWGYLESNYDSKGCTSAIIVTYAE